MGSRITFVQPPNMQRAGKWKSQGVFRSPTNLAILASCVREAGHTPCILDFDALELDFDAMVERLLDTAPDVLGFTCLTPRYGAIVNLARACKSKRPEIVVVIGGAHVSGTGPSVLKDPAIDVAVYGEGERTIVALLDSDKTLAGVPGIYRRDGCDIVTNEPAPLVDRLDDLPYPAWDLLDTSVYTEPNMYDGPHLGIMTARGCPYRCVFCSSHITFGRRVRYHSPRYVVDQLEEVVGATGIHNIMFYDDTFTLDRGRAIAICVGLIERDIQLRFAIQARVNTMDEELAGILKRAGCIATAVGVESGDDDMLRLIDKGTTKAQIRACVAALKAAGLPCVASYIIGLPGETHETVKATLDFADELDTEGAKFMIATPYPGTPLYDAAVSRGKLLPVDQEENFDAFTYYQHVVANMSELTDAELRRYQQEAYDRHDAGITKEPNR